MSGTEGKREKSRQCDCGYLESGVLPGRLCYACGDRALRAWEAEEKSLLGRMPGYATAVAELVRETAKNQDRALKARANEPFADAAWERSKGARGLPRIRRAHKNELAQVQLDRWNDAAAVVGHDPRELFRKESKRFAKRGLGAAALTALGAVAMEDLLKVVRSRNG